MNKLLGFNYVIIIGHQCIKIWTPLFELITTITLNKPVNNG
jgi:hypothetical protein